MPAVDSRLVFFLVIVCEETFFQGVLHSFSSIFTLWSLFNLLGLFGAFLFTLSFHVLRFRIAELVEPLLLLNWLHVLLFCGRVFQLVQIVSAAIFEMIHRFSCWCRNFVPLNMCTRETWSANQYFRSWKMFTLIERWRGIVMAQVKIVFTTVCSVGRSIKWTRKRLSVVVEGFGHVRRVGSRDSSAAGYDWSEGILVVLVLLFKFFEGKRKLDSHLYVFL